MSPAQVTLAVMEPFEEVKIVNRNVLCKVRASFHIVGDICNQTLMPGKPTITIRKRLVTHLSLALVVLVLS